VSNVGPTTPPDGAVSGDQGGTAPPPSEEGEPVGDTDVVDVDELYRQQQPVLRRRLRRAGRRVDAEDLSHDAFVKTWANRRSLDGSAEGGRAYLHSAAASVLRDRWRRERRAARGDLRLTGGAETSHPGAETIAVAHLEAQLVRSALSHLGEDKREVLRLRVVEGRSSEETARLTGKTPAAVRQIQRRALLALRDELAAKGWARPDSAVRRQPPARQLEER